MSSVCRDGSADTKFIHGQLVLLCIYTVVSMRTTRDRKSRRYGYDYKLAERLDSVIIMHRRSSEFLRDWPERFPDDRKVPRQPHKDRRLTPA